MHAITLSKTYLKFVWMSQRRHLWIILLLLSHKHVEDLHCRHPLIRLQLEPHIFVVRYFRLNIMILRIENLSSKYCHFTHLMLVKTFASGIQIKIGELQSSLLYISSQNLSGYLIQTVYQVNTNRTLHRFLSLYNDIQSH